MRNLLFVDDEPTVLQGLRRQMRPMRHQWNMHFTDSGQKALDFMADNPVDVIVADMAMPDMDGSELLTEVTKRHSNTVRIVVSAPTEQAGVLRTVGAAHQYLAKPCDSAELRDAISRAFSLRDLLGNERLKELATRVKCLPTLPVLYEQLTAEFEKEYSSMEQIGELISRDMGMCTKILQLVNSAYFGLPQPIHDPANAVLYLGLTTVRSLVLSLEVFSKFEQPKVPGFSLDVLAHHCWMTGVAARRLAEAEAEDMKVRDQCFLAGLLHDVGQLILATGLPEDYTRVVARAKGRNLPLVLVEQEFFGATHADVGAYLLALWGLPNPIIEAVALHHFPSGSIAENFSPVTAVHVADVFMHERNRSKMALPMPILDMAHLSRLGLADQLDSWRAVGLGEEEF